MMCIWRRSDVRETLRHDSTGHRLSASDVAVVEAAAGAAGAGAAGLGDLAPVNSAAIGGTFDSWLPTPSRAVDRRTPRAPSPTGVFLALKRIEEENAKTRFTMKKGKKRY